MPESKKCFWFSPDGDFVVDIMSITAMFTNLEALEGCQFGICLANVEDVMYTYEENFIALREALRLHHSVKEVS